jgi:two-component system, cell cycle response regulator DivK
MNFYPVNDMHSNESYTDSDIEDLEKSLKILVAEDDDINYMFVEYLFIGSKHKLIRAANGQLAVDVFNLQPDVDIILMDLKMPVMSGYEAARIIKSTHPKVPIIALTAHVFDEDKEKAMSAGCDDFIAKPYRMEDLFGMIIRLVS